MAAHSVTCEDESPDSLADEDEEESPGSLADEDARGDEGETDSATCEDGSSDALADEDGATDSATRAEAERDATGDEAEQDIDWPGDLFGTKPGLGRLGPDMAPVRTGPILKITCHVLKKTPPFLGSYDGAVNHGV